MFYSWNQYSEDLPVFVVCFMSFLLLFSTCYKAWFLLSELEIEARCEMQFTCIGLGAPQTNGKTGRTRSQGCCFFLFWGGGLAHVQYLSEPGIWELLPPPQTPASGDPTAAIPLSAEVAVTLHSKKAVSVQSLLPVSLTQVLLTHKIPIIPSSHLVMTCCQHWNMFFFSRSSLQNPWQISKPMWSSAFYRRIFYSISYLYLEYRLHLHYF